MSRLSSLLVQEGAIPVKRMEQAFQRQVIYGGSLDTILLEMGVLGEPDLVRYLARAAGFSPAPPDLLARADSAAARALPRGVAEKFTVAPLAFADGKLQVVVNEPAEAPWTQALSAAVGAPVEPLVTTELRYNQLLERQYGKALPPRLAGLAAKLGAEPVPAAAAQSKTVATPAEPQRPERSERDEDAGQMWAGGPSGERAAVQPAPATPSARETQPLGSTPAAHAVVVAPESPSSGVPGNVRRTAPLGRLIAPPEPAGGPPADDVETREEEALPGEPTEPMPVLPEPAPAVDPIPTLEAEDDAPPEGIDAALALARERLATATDRDTVLDALAAGAAAFLEYVAVLSVRGTNLVGRVTFTSGEIEHVSASGISLDAQPGTTLRQAMEGNAPYIGPLDRDESGQVLLQQLGRQPPSALLLPVAIKGRVVALLYGDRGARPVSVTRVAPLLPLVQQVGEAFLSLIVQAKASRSGPNPMAGLEGLTPTGGVPLAVHSQPTQMFNAASPGMAVAIPVASHPTVALAAQPAPAGDLDRLVEAVDRGDPASGRTAADALVETGAPALTAIVRRFPGRLLVDPRAARGRLPASQHGGLLALVARFDVAAAPALVPLLADPNPLVRFYATYLFAEIRAPEVVRHLHWRLYDGDPLVRTAAVEALRSYAGTAGLHAVIEALRADLVDPDPIRRRAAAETLGELRDVEAIPRLIEVACSEDEIAGLAQRSLVILTRQDFATSRRKWRAWWDKNRKRHRVEWLLDALLAKEPEHRMAAKEELSRLAGSSFGYQFDLPKRELGEAHRRFVEWWESEGRARLGVAPG